MLPRDNRQRVKELRQDYRQTQLHGGRPGPIVLACREEDATRKRPSVDDEMEEADVLPHFNAAGPGRPRGPGIGPQRV